jgi:hypothetical protein
MQKNDGTDYLKFETSVGSTSITVCILIRVLSGHMSYLPAFAIALNHTGFDKIRLYIISIDKNVDKQWLSRTIKMINTMVGRENYISALNVGPFEKDDFGFISMDRALTYLYKQHERSPSICEYVILTDSNTLYSRHFGKHILPHMSAKKDIITWNFVSEQYWPNAMETSNGKQQVNSEIVDSGTEKCVSTAIEIAHVPLGSAAYRLAFLKRHNLHIRYPNGTYSRKSDEYFFRTAATLTNVLVILKQTLTHP